MSSAMSVAESVELLDGGAQAYPRMFLAIAEARVSIELEVYAFARSGVGARFVEALAAAAGRGVNVRVVIDGWGSASGGRAVAAALREAGCTVRIHNRLLALLIGRFGRNHRKILLVDDRIAFLGGINIGDENVSAGKRVASADVAVEIRGPQCVRLGQVLRREPIDPVDSSLRIYLCGLGGGWRLRRRYLESFAEARECILIAHGYFLPDPGVVKAIIAAARRGVEVHLLLAGRTNHPIVRSATTSLYRPLLAAGVRIHEWTGSLLHAKLGLVDGRRLLVGSFNLDRYSLANLEALVQIDDMPAVGLAHAWIEDRIARARTVTLAEVSSRLHRWVLDPLGRLVARLADAVRRVLAHRRRHRVGSDQISLSDRNALSAAAKNQPDGHSTVEP